MENNNTVIYVDKGKLLQRIHDSFISADENTPLKLGYDYSTGVKRIDKAEYYQEIDEPIEEIENNTDFLT